MISQKLSHEDLKSTWKKFKETNDEESKNQLINHYFSYVQKIAVKVAEKMGWQVQPDALTSFGVDGLYKAIEGYDISQNVKFESYASRRIKGSMIDGLRREDDTPRSVRMATDQFNKHKERMENYLGFRLSNVDFVNMIGMDESDYHNNFRKYNASSSASLDCHVDDSGPEDIRQDSNDYLIDDKCKSPDSDLCRKEFFSKLMSMNFNEMERKIIYLHYYEGYTMEKVAKVIKKSESRVSQLHKKILNRLKDKIDRNPNYFDEEVTGFIKDCNDIGSVF